MQTVRNIGFILLLVLFSSIIIGGLYWANLGIASQAPAPVDFIIPWKAMQNYMMKDVSPYGSETAQLIQSTLPRSHSTPGNYPDRVNTPLFMLVFYIPLSWLSDFSTAYATWMVIIELALFLAVFIALRLSHWKPNRFLLPIIALFFVFWQPAFSALTAGTSILLQSLLMLLALRTIELDGDELAGALLAFCLLNIEATGFVLLILFVWIISTERWRILGGFGMTLFILICISLILDYTWALSFIGSLISNWRSSSLPSTYSVFEAWMPGIGSRIAQIFSIAALALFIKEIRAVRGKDVRWLYWTVCVTIAITPLIGLTYFPYWIVFTLPGLLLVFSVMVQRWKLPGLISTLILMITMSWSLWAAQLAGFTSVFIFFYPIFLTVLLYWVRWGAVRRPRLWANEIQALS